MNRSGLAGLRVLVTGASGAIGAATAAELQRRGAAVAGLDVRPEEGVIAADIRDEAAVRRAVAEAVARLGGLDVLVNNAGLGDAVDAGLAPGLAARAMMDVNLFGAWRVTAAAMPHLLESHGRVINVVSGLARVNLPMASAYMASKRALAGWTDGLRLEYSGRLSAVTAVHPGYVRTPIHAAAAARGVSMEGAVPAEPISATVGAIVSACSGRPRRELASTRRTAAALLVARIAPGLLDAVIRRRARSMRASLAAS